MPVTGPPADPAVGSHCQGPAGGWRKKGQRGGGSRTGTQPPGHPREKASQAPCPTQGCWEGKEAGKGEMVRRGKAGSRQEPGDPGGGCPRPARFPPWPGKHPAQRSLSSPGTELVSRLAAPRGTGTGRSQEVRRAAGLQEQGGPPGGPLAPAGTTVSAGSGGASPAWAQTLHVTPMHSRTHRRPPRAPLSCLPPIFLRCGWPSQGKCLVGPAPPRLSYPPTTLQGS